MSFENLLTTFRDDEDGATAMEYGLIAALISIGVLILVNGPTADGVKEVFNTVSDGLDNGELDSSVETSD